MQKKIKKKIINILYDPPNYEAYAGTPRPQHHWDIDTESPNGEWVGVWGYDWPDLLGAGVLKISDDFQYEVWQPDTRADRLYAAQLDSGVVHRLFPAVMNNGAPCQCRSLLDGLEQEINSGSILNFNDFKSAEAMLAQLEAKGITKKFPVVLTCHGAARMPIYRLRRLKRIWKIPTVIRQDLRFRKMLKKIDAMTMQHDNGIDYFRKFYEGRIEKVTMGCDFDFWQPAPADYDRNWFYDKYGCRGKKIFLNACNFSPVKQLDRLIAGLEAISRREDFFLLIAGHGAPGYEEYLRKTASKLLEKGLLAFHPYTRGEKLRNLYWAADFYINTSVTEGGPVAVFNALACNIPVVATNTGGAAEFLNQTSTGCVLPVNSGDNWSQRFTEILDGQPVPTAPRDEALKIFDRESIARKYIGIYRDLWNQYNN
jgi:glycosyltransferase involved in cell wall biosynthesis